MQVRSRRRTRLCSGAGVLGLLLSLAPLGPATAVEVPNGDVTQAFSIQTNGPSGAIGLGDYYSASAVQGGAHQPHQLLLRVPCSWPAAVPIHLDLFSAPVNTHTTGFSGSGTYEEPNGAGDVATFELRNPGGVLVTTTSYPSIDAVTDSWTRFTTLTAPVTCGTYALTSTTSTDDQNGWRLRFAADDDGLAATTPPANADNPDGVLGTDDELVVGLQRTSYQHDFGDGSPAAARCLTLYEYVEPGVGSVTFHNFDLDGASLAGSGVRYYAPSAAFDPTGQSGGIVGTLSANGTWNRLGGGGTTTRSGDTISNPEGGWWKIVTCLNNHNQFVQEGQTAQPAYFAQPPTPALQISKTDGNTVVDPGQRLTYAVTLSNTASGSTAGAATAVVARDTLPAGLTPVSCAITAAVAGETCAVAGQVATATFNAAIAAGGTRTFSVVADVGTSPPASLVNTVSATYADLLGNPHAPATASDTDTLASADLSITKTHSGSFTVGGSGSYSITVANAGPSRARGVRVVDTLPAGLTFASGSGTGWSCGAAGQVVTCDYAPDLAAGTTTTLTLGVSVGTTAFPGLTNTASVSSSTPDPASGNNASSDPTTVTGASIGDLVFDDADGSGTVTSGETGLSGVPVSLSQGGTVIATTSTSGTGGYSFTGLAAGTYVVAVTTPSGYAGTGPQTSPRTVTVLADQADTDEDFGFRRVNQPPVFSGATGNTTQTIPVGGTPVPVTATDPEAGSLTYTLTAGTLPPTVTLNPDGTFSGTATTAAGPTTVTITVTDDRGATDTTDLTITVAAPANRPPVAGDDSASTTAGVAVPTLVLTNDTDLDGDPLSVQSVTKPANGTVSCSATSCSYTPAAGFTGSDFYDYVVSDGRGLTDTGRVTVTVAAAPNRPPVFDGSTGNTTQTIPVGGTPAPVTAADPDGGPLVYTVTAGALPPLVTLNSDGTFSGTATTPGGPATVTITATDPNGATATTVLAITVAAPPPSPPVATDDTATTPTNTGVTINVLSNDTDPDGDVLSVSGHSDPPNGTVVCTSTCRYTPDPGYTGTDSLTYTVSDGTGTDTGTVSVTVLNAPPAFDSSTGNTAQTVPVGSTPSPLSAGDPNSDPLTYAVTVGTLPVGLTLNPGGTFSGTAATPGTATVTVTVSDGRGGEDDTVLTLTFVAPVNQPPNAMDDSGTAAGVPVTLTVLGNDTDPDGDSLTVATFTQPANGTVTCTATACTYTPDPGYTGPDSFAYAASDGTDTDVATVSLTVTALNRPPVAVPDSASTVEDTPVTFSVLANDSDPDSDPLALASRTATAHGTVTCTAGVCTYTPTAGYSGPDAFTYTISDGRGGTATTTVTVTVTPAEDPPAPVRDQATTPSGTPVTVSVLLNDSDPDGDPLTLASAGTPGHGTVSCTTAGVCTYVPDAGFVGNDSFSYVLSDGTRARTGRVDLRVTGAPPVVVPEVPPVVDNGSTPGTVVGPGGGLPTTGTELDRQLLVVLGLFVTGFLLLLAGRRRA